MTPKKGPRPLPEAPSVRNRNTGPRRTARELNAAETGRSHSPHVYQKWAGSSNFQPFAPVAEAVSADPRAA